MRFKQYSDEEEGGFKPARFNVGSVTIDKSVEASVTYAADLSEIQFVKTLDRFTRTTQVNRYCALVYVKIS